MSEFEYLKMLEQIRNERDQKQREELFNFIGENGDDRFIEPLTQLLKTDDSPEMRFSLYTTFAKIGSELAEEVIKEQVRTKLPKDDGKKITKSSWSEAVEFLNKNLELSFINKVKEIIASEGRLWGFKNKGGVGVYIRNLLRNNGFNWGEHALETYWSWVVEDVLNKKK
ncbi:MAG TPA: HEAT repeat domain-containing protein [candidate division Zixibacteria bacterium]|nr:HEAT repeat domain-containing protein [candidate division Zixibacteria bacterium]HUU88048.1 HEAT repeat domain-containing protein [Candidatus Glassbacteria bacterium]